MSDWRKLLGLAAILFLALFSLIAAWDRPSAPVRATGPMPVESGAGTAAFPTVVPAPRAPAKAAAVELLPRFQKLDRKGNVLPESAQAWDCVRDNRQKLVWEVKQANGGLRDLDFTYSWYSADKGVGIADGGRCFYIYCDTDRLVEAVNKEGLCGWRDWRLPTSQELMTLDTDREYYSPDIDQRFFPHTSPGYYWTATPANVGATLVWSINFLNGFPYVTEMRLAHHVRLVRSE